jgi:FtsZ-interacting cell division protein ZipA
MSPTLIVVIVIAVLVVIGIALMVMRKREGERLKERFGPEYDRQVREAGSETKAQAELLKREKRVEKLDIRPLPPEQRHAFAEDWQQVQARFVDDPERSIALADALVAEVMKARGYPVDDFEQRAADISVEHPEVVQNYRAAHDIAVRREQGKADTEDLRSALLGYRNLFDELLRADAPELAH